MSRPKYRLTLSVVGTDVSLGTVLQAPVGYHEGLVEELKQRAEELGRMASTMEDSVGGIDKLVEIWVAAHPTGGF